MKILVVEDNLSLAKRIKLALGKYFLVDVVDTGEEALSHLEIITYEVIILDLGLPGMSGLEVCRAIRERGLKTPMLILTGIDTIKSRVQLLECGADDYVTKPFNTPELVARVNALARRQSRAYIDNVMIVGDLEVDVNRRVVRRAGVEVPLRRKEFDILQYLVSNQGRTVSREMIIDHAWEHNQERWNNSVDVHIKRLRDKIDRPFPSPIIKTAYGIGYMVESAP
jgi:two-component system OmpR family response regulator